MNFCRILPHFIANKVFANYIFVFLRAYFANIANVVK